MNLEVKPWRLQSPVELSLNKQFPVKISAQLKLVSLPTPQKKTEPGNQKITRLKRTLHELPNQKPAVETAAGKKIFMKQRR